MPVTRLTTLPDPGAAAREAASRIAELIDAARGARGAAHVALCGGDTPRRAFELLGERLEDWGGVELWFGDERAVGADDPDSNYLMVARTLLAAIASEPPLVHRIEGERGAEAAAESYAELLRERAPAGPDGMPALDLALQGLGPDGHTASLFPGNPALDADGVCAAVHDSPKPPPDRITMTVGALRASRAIVYLVTGSSKAEAVRGLLGDPDPAVPASLLGGDRTEVIADAEAAALAAG